MSFVNLFVVYWLCCFEPQPVSIDRKYIHVFVCAVNTMVHNCMMTYGVATDCSDVGQRMHLAIVVKLSSGWPSNLTWTNKESFGTAQLLWYRTCTSTNNKSAKTIESVPRHIASQQTAVFWPSSNCALAIRCGLEYCVPTTREQRRLKWRENNSGRATASHGVRGKGTGFLRNICRPIIIYRGWGKKGFCHLCLRSGIMGYSSVSPPLHGVNNLICGPSGMSNEFSLELN